MWNSLKQWWHKEEPTLFKEVSILRQDVILIKQFMDSMGATNLDARLVIIEETLAAVQLALQASNRQENKIP